MSAARYRGHGPRPAGDLDGLLLLDKPAGPTSHDIVDVVRRLFAIEKVGHGGTLDPGATGLLILLLGRATKLSQAVMSTDKTYEGSLLLGIETDTHDAEGDVVARNPAGAISRERLESEMRKWVGDVEQVPPMVSAIKKDGVALYKMARAGQEVAREPRILHIFEFALLDFTPPLARFRVRCSKGTYVRTLCHDVGLGLGCGACMNTLHRTQSGRWHVRDAVRFEDLVTLDRAGLARHVQPLVSLLQRP